MKKIVVFLHFKNIKMIPQYTISSNIITCSSCNDSIDMKGKISVEICHCRKIKVVKLRTKAIVEFIEEKQRININL